MNQQLIVLQMTLFESSKKHHSVTSSLYSLLISFSLLCEVRGKFRGRGRKNHAAMRKIFIIKKSYTTATRLQERQLQDKLALND